MKKVHLLMDSQALTLALNRIAHQILERNPGPAVPGIVGMQTRGVFLARRLNEILSSLSGSAIESGILDPTLYRDDYRQAFKQPKVQVTDIPFDINGRDIILVDDVLFTGRTVRAALDALMDLGRPRTIQLAVILDRGRRELPIRADYVGKKITTAETQEIALLMREKDGEDALWLLEPQQAED